MVIKCHHGKFFSGAEQGAGEHLKAASSSIYYNAAGSWERQGLRVQPDLICHSSCDRLNSSVLKGQRANTNPPTTGPRAEAAQVFAERVIGKSTIFTNSEWLFAWKQQ